LAVPVDCPSTSAMPVDEARGACGQGSQIEREARVRGCADQTQIHNLFKLIMYVNICECVCMYVNICELILVLIVLGLTDSAC
jgi:hypothetical protein